MDNVRFIPAIEARAITEASDVSFNKLIGVLMREIREAAAAGKYWVDYPETENIEVRKRLNGLLSTHGYRIVENRAFPGDAISWEPLHVGS